MNELQKKFAKENHNVLISFMIKNNLNNDWYGLLAIAYCKAVVTYNPHNKASFRTYCYVVLKNAYIQELRRLKNKTTILSDTLEQVAIEPTVDVENNVLLKVAIDNTKNKLNDLQLKIFELRINGYTQVYIRNKLNISQSKYATNLKKIRNILNIELGRNAK